MRALVLLFLVGCTGTPAALDASVPDAPLAPRRVTLTVETFGMPGPGLRLADGATLAIGEGDLWLEQRSTLALFARAPETTICPLGTFASLDAAPTDEASCLNGLAQADVVGTNMDGTDRWIGRTWLVVSSAATYRVRDVGDSVAAGTDTLTLEYAPIP